MTEDDRPLCVDLFCGKGGWARGFIDAGYRVRGFDNRDMSKWYPGEFTLADVCDLDGYFFQGARVVVASPPCTEFSTFLKGLNVKRWGHPPPDPEKGMRLVRTAIQFIRRARPEWWAIENVDRSRRFINRELGHPTYSNHPWYLWGNLPALMPGAQGHFPKGAFVQHNLKSRGYSRPGPEPQSSRAIVPYRIARALADACLPEGSP
jgi:hypothetical protein